MDEGHILKDESTVQSRAICSLSSPNRWIMTGTPLNNTPMDIFGQAWYLGCLSKGLLAQLRQTLQPMINHVRDPALQQVEIFSDLPRVVSSLSMPSGLAKAALVRLFTRLVVRHTTDQQFNGRKKLLELKGLRYYISLSFLLSLSLSVSQCLSLSFSFNLFAFSPPSLVLLFLSHESNTRTYTCTSIYIHPLCMKYLQPSPSISLSCSICLQRGSCVSGTECFGDQCVHQTQRPSAGAIQK